MAKDLLYPELMGCKCIKRDENIYFFAKNYNALCRINLTTKVMDVAANLFNEKFDKEYLVTKFLEYKNELICIPHTAKQIYVIDLEEKRGTEHIKLEKKSLYWRSYCNAYLEKDFCYLFPFTGSEIIRVDLDRKEIAKTLNIRKMYKEAFGEDYIYFSCSDCHVVENRIYMIMFENATIMEMDVGSMSLCFYKMEGTSKNYIHLTGCGHQLYVLGGDGRLYIWNVKKHVLENTLQLKFAEKENGRYIYSTEYEKYIYIFKYIPSDEFIRIDTETNLVEVLSLAEVFNLDEKKHNLLSYMVREDGRLYFLSKSSEVLELDINTKEVNIVPILLAENEVCKYIKMQEKQLNVKETEPIVEGYYVWTLENYIKKYINMAKEKHTVEVKKIGNSIFEGIKTELR